MKSGRLAETASILAAMGVSVCCLGPFVLVTLGLGTAAGAISAFFAPLRPILLTLAFGIVGWRLIALYRVARTNKAKESTCCPPENRDREKAITWSVLGIITLFAASPYLLAALPTSVPKSARTLNSSNSGNGDICLAIEGMTCSGCSRNVETALAGEPGVVSAVVHFDRREACLTVDKERTPTTAKLLSVIEAAGYRAKTKAIGG